MWPFNFAGFFDIFRITKSGKVILLQSVTDCYYKVRQVLQIVTDCYYKMRQVLQIVTDLITKSVRYYSVAVITKWDVTHQGLNSNFHLRRLYFTLQSICGIEKVGAKKLFYLNSNMEIFWTFLWVGNCINTVNQRRSV